MNASIHHHKGRHLTMNGIWRQNGIGGLRELIAYGMRPEVEAQAANAELQRRADDEIWNKLDLFVSECAFGAGQIATPHHRPSDQTLTTNAALYILVEKPPQCELDSPRPGI